jgi:hypothetical protein
MIKLELPHLFTLLNGAFSTYTLASHRRMADDVAGNVVA